MCLKIKLGIPNKMYLGDDVVITEMGPNRKLHIKCFTPQISQPYAYIQMKMKTYIRIRPPLLNIFLELL